MLQIDVLTLFPGMFKGVFGESIIKRAITKRLVSIKIHNLRDWSEDKHRKADDAPYGGGPGMLLSCQPIFDAVKELKPKIKDHPRPEDIFLKGNSSPREKPKIILLSPQGKRFDQRLANRLAKEKRLILICGHYEGVDERVKKVITDEVSIGDYVLTGGEIPAMVLIDAITRLIPGALGNKKSTSQESFQTGLLEYPQYTRPRDYKGLKVPQVLVSGDHERIEEWRHNESVRRTRWLQEKIK